jgi:hypothetical protein
MPTTVHSATHRDRNLFCLRATQAFRSKGTSTRRKGTWHARKMALLVVGGGKGARDKHNGLVRTQLRDDVLFVDRLHGRS